MPASGSWSLDILRPDVAHALSVPRPHSCGRRGRSPRTAGFQPAPPGAATLAQAARPGTE